MFLRGADSPLNTMQWKIKPVSVKKRCNNRIISITNQLKNNPVKTFTKFRTAIESVN